MLCVGLVRKHRVKQWIQYHRAFWKIYLRNLALLLTLCSISVVLVCLDEDLPPWIRGKIWKINFQQLASDYSNDDTVFMDKSVSSKLYDQVKVLCLILTTKYKLKTKIPLVEAAWTRRCNKVMYILCPDQDRYNVISTCHVGESKSHLTGKVRHAFTYSYQHYLSEYDWFLKADDDSFFVMENLRYLLSQKTTSKGAYLGYHFNKYMKQGYTSGGAGYVINRVGLKHLVETGFKTGACLEDGGDEDVEMGRCLEASGVKLLPSSDRFGRETFHSDKPWQHILGTFPTYLHVYAKNPVKMGAGCCSQFVVSFHHVDPATMAFLHHLLYRTSVYGQQGWTNATNMFP